MIWLLSLGWAGPDPCATSRMLEPGLLRTGEPPRLDSRSVKQERDAYGAFPNQLNSENFVIKWGNTGGVSRDQVYLMLEQFEDSLVAFVDRWGHTPLWGTEDYYFNVYIGDTGDGTPSSNGAGGYFTGDPDGWPMIVVALDSVLNPEFLEIVVPHELYHAIQATEGRFASETTSLWFWEATATWAAAQLFPRNVYSAIFLPDYAAFTPFELNYFNPISETDPNLPVTYQYGAFLFPQHLTEFIAPNIVIDTWQDPGTQPDPLEVLREQLQLDGYDLDEVWLDHCAHMVVHDYNHGDVYQQVLQAVDMAETTHYDKGTDGVIQMDASRLRRYGFFAHQLLNPVHDNFDFMVNAYPISSQNNISEMGARVIHQSQDGVKYYDLTFENYYASKTVRNVSPEDTLWLVVGVWADQLFNEQFDSEYFGYEFSIARTPGVIDGGSSGLQAKLVPADSNSSESSDRPKAEAAVCGCSSASPASSAGLFALCALYWRRRQ